MVGPLAVGLLAVMLLSAVVGAALGGGGEATLGDRVALDLLVRLSARWCGFRRHVVLSDVLRAPVGPLKLSFDLTFRDDFISYLSKHY